MVCVIRAGLPQNAGSLSVLIGASHNFITFLPGRLKKYFAGMKSFKSYKVMTGTMLLLLLTACSSSDDAGPAGAPDQKVFRY